MGIKINELQVNVNFEEQQTADASTKSNGVNDSCGTSGSNQELIDDTVKEVLRILNERNER